MANNTNKLNDIWGKVLGFFGYRDIPNPWLANTTIDEPLTLYVETTGNDLNPGTQSRPLKTIQAAIDSLLNVTIASVVTIKVGTGDFDGFEIPQLSVVKAGQLNIEGTRTTIATGSITSGPSGTGVVVDNVTNLSSVVAGDFIDIGGGGYGAIYQKVGSDRLETTSGFNGTIGTTYIVYRNLTNILPTKLSSRSGSTPYAILSMVNVPSDGGLLATSAPVVVKYTNASITSGQATARLEGDGIGCYGCQFSLAETGSGVIVAGRSTVQSCHFINTSSSRTSITLGTFGRLINPRIVSCSFDGTGSTSAVAIGGVGSASSVDIFVSGIVINYASPVSVDASSASAINGTISLNVQGATTAHSFIGRRANISIGLSSFAFSNPITNTTWLSVAKGASAQIAASATAQGTTEISVDGTTTTLAAMRALSPKAFPATPNVYGTVVYE